MSRIALAGVRRSASIAFLALSSVCLFPEVRADSLLHSFTVRMFPTTEAIKALQAISTPVGVPVKAGDNLHAILTERCGDTASEVEGKAKALNPGLISPDWKATGTGMFRVPACLRAYRDVTIAVPAGATPAQEISRVTGSRDPQTRQDVIEKNPQIQSTAEDPQPGDRTVTYPVVPAFTTIQVPANQADAIARLTMAAGPAGAAAEITPTAQLNLIRPVTDSDVSGNNACAQPPGADIWPFSLLEVLRVLVGLKTHGMKVILPALVVAADTGMPGQITGFPAGIFDAGNPFAPHDVINDSLTFDGDPDAGHGTVVASLILGGPAFLAVDQAPESRMALRMVNVEHQWTVANTGGGPPVTHFEVEEARVSNAVTQVRGRPPDILNISLESDRPVPTLEAQIRLSPGLLVVSAAGNSGDDLSLRPHYPAALGGESGAFASQVITVSAHDPSGMLLARSNYGSRYSDIAAPGCDVLAIGSDGHPNRFNGTSVAAPLVTFTALLLHAYGLVDPQEVKERILDSADVTADLMGKVVSNGKLNIAKALALADDILVESGSGEMHIGTAQVSDPVTLCGVVVAAKNLRKLWTLPLAGKPGSFTATITYRDALGHRTSARCEDPQLTVGFKDSVSGQATTYMLSQIHDFVPARLPGH